MSDWKLDAAVQMSLDVTVPGNTTATVEIPAASRWSVNEGGRPAAGARPAAGSGTGAGGRWPRPPTSIAGSARNWPAGASPGNAAGAGN